METCICAAHRRLMQFQHGLSCTDALPGRMVVCSLQRPYWKHGDLKVKPISKGVMIMHQLGEAARLTGREYVRLFQLSYGNKLQQEVNIKDEIKPQAFCWARVCVVPNKALPTLLVGCSDSRL